MRNLISKLRFERLRKVFSDASTDEGSKSATSEVLEIQEAMALVEAMTCDLLAHCVEEADDPVRHGAGQNGFSSVNVFGRQVTTVGVPRVGEAIAAGAGAAMTGLRTAVFLPGDHLSEGYSQLQLIAARHVPLVVHATFREGYGTGSSHVGYHGAGELGLFQAMPRSVQQAIDLVVLSRWVAERSLLPGLVAIDRRMVESAALPTGEQLRDFLASPSAVIATPTPAQQLIFGNERPAVPAWFDDDHPVSFGSLQGSSDGASATVGRYAFFQSHLPAILAEGMEKLSAVTGRQLSLVDTDELERSDFVLVTQGSAYETARAAAHYLRQENGIGVGVLGVTWLRPFPREVIAGLLARKRGIAVLECASTALSAEGPLTREVRGALPGESPQWVSAGFGFNGQPLAVGQLIRLVNQMKERKAPPRVWLGIASGPEKLGDFPKRAGLLNAVSNDYPQLSSETLAVGSADKLSAPSLKTVQWIGGANVDTSEVLSKLAEVAGETAGPAVRGFGWYPEPGVLSVRISAGPEAVPVAESGTAVDVLLLGRHGLDLLYNPLAEVREGGSVVIESDRAPLEIWSLLPEFWRSEARRLRLRLFRAGGFEQLTAAASAVLSGGVEVPCDEIEVSASVVGESLDEVPRLIRRIRGSEQRFDSLPRFWGEVMQPKRGGISDNSPDPLATVGAVPPYTAALARPRATAQPQMPVLVAEKCTGCGRCWPVCPDSAIGVSLLGIQEFLDSASDAAGNEGKNAGAVKRAHRNIAARVASILTGRGERRLTEDNLLEAYREVVEKMPVSEADRPEYDQVFGATAAAANRVSPVVCDTFFHSAEKEKKGNGRLLILAINPDACQGCRLCITTCPESALAPYDRAGSVKEDARSGWRLWEILPDTAGEDIESASPRLDPGVLAGRMMSRHASQVQAVGSFGEPGSGERLACRQITAMVESVVQASVVERAAAAQDLSGKLRELVQSHLAQGLTDADPKAIEAALAELPRRRASLAELTERLSSLGRAVSVDPVRTLRLAQCAGDLEEESNNLREGVHGLGRARFGVVIAGHRVARWAGRFPNHPYQAPLVVDLTPEGAGLVLGLAGARALQHTNRVRTFRKGQLFHENPSDLPGRLAQLEELTWADLSADEKRQAQPLLVFMDDSAFNRQGFGALARLMTSGLPVKVVVLDAKGLESAALEPVLFALSFQEAFVLSTSVAHPGHLAEGIAGAIAYAGPALIHVHVPLPQEHGFEPELTLEQARRAVESRIHPLLTFDPTRDGSFGTRLSLDANPDPEQGRWADFSPAEWALGEKRFRRHFTRLADPAKAVDLGDYLGRNDDERAEAIPVVIDPESGEPLAIGPSLLRFFERRLKIWNAYQEMAGLRSPFVERIRSQVKQEVESQTLAEFEKVKADCEAQLAATRQGVDEQITSQLRDRLLSLAGFSPAQNKPESKSEDES